MQFDKKKDHIRYGTSNKRELYFQDGCLFDEQGNLLPHDLEAVQRKGYQITNEIRDQFVKQALLMEKQQRIKELEQELEARKQEMESDWNTKLQEMNANLVAEMTPPPPEQDNPLEIPELNLTPLELDSAITLGDAAAVAALSPEPAAAPKRNRASRTRPA